jgi:hypothetical protein
MGLRIIKGSAHKLFGSLHRFVLTMAMLAAIGALQACRSIDQSYIPPEVFHEQPPFLRQLGTVGIELGSTQIRIQSPTAGELFKKEVWNRIAQGGLIGLEIYRNEANAVDYLLMACGHPKQKCKETAIVVGSLALVAMAIGGIVGGVQAEYSSTMEADLSASLVKAVTQANEELRTALLSNSRSMAFREIRNRNANSNWAVQAFALLDTYPIRALFNSSPKEQSSIDVTVPDSIIDARIISVVFSDDQAWLSSDIELHMEAVATTYTRDGTTLDKRTYQCRSAPRPHRYWAQDSYGPVRTEIVACNELLGRQMAQDLLDATVQGYVRSSNR